jgi:3-oxoacyl-[acyl-carrier protein] reductase
MSASPFQLASHYVIVTGGSSGIGLSIVKLFHDQGAIIDVLDVNQPDDETKISLGLNDETVAFHEIDITNQERVKEIVSLIAIKRGIGILINNAGMAHIGMPLQLRKKTSRKYSM